MKTTLNKMDDGSLADRKNCAESNFTEKLPQNSVNYTKVDSIIFDKSRLTEPVKFASATKECSSELKKLHSIDNSFNLENTTKFNVNESKLSLIIMNHENEKDAELQKHIPCLREKSMKTEEVETLQSKSSESISNESHIIKTSPEIFTRSFGEISKKFTESYEPEKSSSEQNSIAAPSLPVNSNNDIENKCIASQFIQKLHNNTITDQNLKELYVHSPSKTSVKISETNQEKVLKVASPVDENISNDTYKTKKIYHFLHDFDIETVPKQKNHLTSESNDIEIESICTPAISLTHSVFSEDETVVSSYEPETPENQERDQDQESAISSSSYEIPPCEDLNFNNPSIAEDSTNNQDNGILETSTSSFDLNLESSSIPVHLVPTSNYENQLSVNQTISISLGVLSSIQDSDEILIQDPRYDPNESSVSSLRTSSRTYVNKNCNLNCADEIDLYSQQSETMDNFFDNVESHSNLSITIPGKKEEEKISRIYQNTSPTITQENSQNSIPEMSLYESNNKSVSNDNVPREIIQNIQKSKHSDSDNSIEENISDSVSILSAYKDKHLPVLSSEESNLNRPDLDDCSSLANLMNR